MREEKKERGGESEGKRGEEEERVRVKEGTREGEGRVTKSCALLWKWKVMGGGTRPEGHWSRVRLSLSLSLSLECEQGREKSV